MINLNTDICNNKFWEPITKVCTKCKEDKPLTEYNDTVILSKRGDCKTCEADYTKAYYIANKQRIRDNERIRRGRAKKLKQKL
jgi:hypothetical protein